MLLSNPRSYNAWWKIVVHIYDKAPDLYLWVIAEQIAQRIRLSLSVQHSELFPHFYLFACHSLEDSLNQRLADLDYVIFVEMVLYLKDWT